MTYQVSRNGQTYGPYTLEDLRRYLASGNVLPTDLAKSDDMPDYVPVPQLLDAAPPPPPAVPFPAFSAAPTPYAPNPFGVNPALAASPYPDPPDLHWGLVILITIFTNGIFLIVWEFVVAAWLKKVQPQTKTLTQYILGYSLLVGALAVLLIGAGIAFASGRGEPPSPSSFIPAFAIAWLVYMAGFIILIVARFTERASLEAHFNGPDPVGLRLSGVMTFFFGTMYFQYHLNRINALKQAARFATLYQPR